MQVRSATFVGEPSEPSASRRQGPADSERVKRVAILLPNLNGGGAERVALASARDLVAAGHRVDLLLVECKGELLPIVPEGVRVVDFKAHRMLACLPALVRYLRDDRPDALHALMWPLTVIAIVAHRLARSGATLMVSDHNALSLQVPSGTHNLILKLSTRLLYPLADHRILVSQSAADDLASLSGMRRDSIEVIYNPITPPPRIATSEAAESAWKGAGPRIISVGSLKDQKNHALLLDSFARLKTPSAQLMILGEGELRDMLERKAEELEISDRVALPGFAIDPWPYLASAELFVLSSDYEGFGLVLAEAMQVGLRIVSTDCLSGPSEILDKGRFGTLVPCGDPDAMAAAIDAALKAPVDAERMRARAEEITGPAVGRYRALLVGDEA